ncbi:MAG: oligogalacturonate lyase family protein [Tepidisphaeraceae bacterium]|jgi:oligogalacturonide lyase
MPKWLAFAVVVFASACVLAADDSPKDWIDPDTGHRIIRLSEKDGSRTLYFHDNSYTPEGDKLIFNTPDGVAVVDITQLGIVPPQMEIVTQGNNAIMARRSREVYVSRGGRGGRGFGAATQPYAGPATQPTGRRGFGGGFGGPMGPVYAVNVDTKQERLIKNAVSTVINCDETFGFLVVRGAAAIDPTGQTRPPATRPYVSQLQRMFPGKTMADLTTFQQYAVRKEENLARRTLDPQPEAYTFINLKTGERKTTGYQYGDLDHQQWSPTDPNLLLYAHEGSWHEVDRTWTIRSDGSDMRLMHKRTMDMEINGHEWWSFDGKTVWYDLQTPRSTDFWIAGVNIDTGKETRYHIQRDWWGIHFNSSRDNTLFADDGGDPSQVAYSSDGMWINLFRVQPDGTVIREKLVNMSKHNYVTGNGPGQGGIEPNVSITPDKKWVIFTGNMYGGNQVYAVEIAKAK